MNKARTKKSSFTVPTYIESLANEIVSKYRRLDTILSHAPTKGTYHEKILRNMIRSYLPTTYSVGEGFIINKEGKTSSQMDILLVDNLDPRSFGYKDDDFYIAANSAVTCFGEVKTSATQNSFIKAFHKLVEASLIMGGDHSARATSFIFCYDVQASKESFRKWPDVAISKLSEFDKTNVWNYPDYIFCLTKKIMLERRQIPGGMQYYSVFDQNPDSNLLQQMIMEKLFQCVTDGCGRIRMYQGINLIDR